MKRHRTSGCIRRGLLLLSIGWASIAAAGERITIAAASDLKFALDEIVADYRATHRDDSVEVVYGSSGKFQTQIRQGAPYDLYFSADIAYPQALVDEGLAQAPVQAYAVGRLVLWSADRDASQMTLTDLRDPAIHRIAIANPQHAPYGQRAEQALRAAGVWDAVQPRLVFGDNIVQAAQFAQTGNAEVGIIALSLALSPELAEQGSYALVPERLHQPLLQGMAVTARARDNVLARRFADFFASAPARAVLQRYGFQARISHTAPTAAADTLAVVRRAPSIRLNVPSSTSSPSLSPRGAPQRRLGVLDTDRCGKCGLAPPAP